MKDKWFLKNRIEGNSVIGRLWHYNILVYFFSLCGVIVRNTTYFAALRRVFFDMSRRGIRRITFHSDVALCHVCMRKNNVIFRNLEYFRRAVSRLYAYIGISTSSAA